jgi:hypothetical protein
MKRDLTILALDTHTVVRAILTLFLSPFLNSFGMLNFSPFLLDVDLHIWFALGGNHFFNFFIVAKYWVLPYTVHTACILEQDYTEYILY